MEEQERTFLRQSLQQYIYRNVLFLGVLGSTCSFNQTIEPENAPYRESSSRAVCNVGVAEDGNISYASVSDPKTLKVLFKFSAEDSGYEPEPDPMDRRYVGEAEMVDVQEGPTPLKSRKRIGPDGNEVLTRLGFPAYRFFSGPFEVVMDGESPESCKVDGKTFPVPKYSPGSAQSSNWARRAKLEFG